VGSDCFYKEIDNLVEITLKVVPNAKKTEAAGVENGALKLRLAALPIEGRANNELISFFSKSFKISKSDIEILSGELGRNKRIRVVKSGRLSEFLRGYDER
jgi:uncharacterized protein (TIGR00251 family)